MHTFNFKRTVLGYFNIRLDGSDEIIATLSLEDMKHYVPNITIKRFIGHFKAEMNTFTKEVA